MAKKQPSYFNNYDTQKVLAIAFEVYNKQGFIRSGEGYQKYDANGVYVGEVKDNKNVVLSKMENDEQPTQEAMDTAKEVMDKFNGKFMLKKLTGGLTNFEQSVSRAFSDDLSTFHVAVIASIPHMNQIDVKRKAVEDKIESVRFSSEYFGSPRHRYDITVEVIDVKFIQSSGVYMITTLHNDKDIIKFWWRDQPDLTDIIDGKTISIRGTVIKHEKSKYTQAHETMMNRVKIQGN